MIFKQIILISITTFTITAFLKSQETLEIEGALKIGTNINSPSPGTIRFNESINDFEGWNGEWKSLTNSFPSHQSVIGDLDGNYYLTFTVGDQTWMRENLRTSTYSNGEPIPEVMLFSEWSSLETGVWSWYDNDYSNELTYGKLYNWYAVIDERGLCPIGWHVPTFEEWTTLIDNLAGVYVAGGKMKSTGTFQAGTGIWSEPNQSATNESGFTGFPGGSKGSTQFYFKGLFGYWWTSTEFEFDATQANMTYLHYFENQIYRIPSPKLNGLSIRCIQDP